jgi:hypothetical protein
MNKENASKLWKIIQEAGDALEFADDSLKNDPDILAIVNKDK